MEKSFCRVNGMQHIGVAVSNMDKVLPLYRKLFGMDIPFFDSIQPAPLMNVYTRNQTITKRASMVINLQGGCAMEVIQATSFVGVKNKNEFHWGDIGINSIIMKSRDVQNSLNIIRTLVAECGEMTVRPDDRPVFSLKDLDGNIFQVTSDENWYSNNGHHSGGVLGCVIGVSNIESSLKLYADILGFDKVVYDQSGIFEDWKGLPGGDQRFRRVLLVASKPTGGGFAKVTGSNCIELVQALDRIPKKIFTGRIWGDLGFVHLGLDVKGMKMLTYIKDLSSSSLKLLEDLLDVSKIESGTIKLQLKKENYINFITKYMYFNLLISKKKDINIRLETNEKELFFQFDEHYLSEVINNLLTNAIKFSFPKSEILIKISTSNNFVKTEIIDQGQGIPVEEQTKLFNYFQKTSVQPTSGETSSGLGLAIAKKIIVEHKGTIGVISEINKGATFYFELPLK
jgi:catechol 2,3-dioxygenase-like lactoylglutathione lyase family enzyme